MKKLGFRLWRFTSESEVVAALTVQGGKVKNKMKGGVYNKPPYSRPPPLTFFFSIGTPLSANKFLFADTVSANYFLFADTLSANNLFHKGYTNWSLDKP